MTIESSGHSGPRYRVNPDHPRQVDVQRKPRAKWTFYGVCDSHEQARRMVWLLEKRNGQR